MVKKLPTIVSKVDSRVKGIDEISPAFTGPNSGPKAF